MKIGLLTGKGALPYHVIAGAKEAGFNMTAVTFNGLTHSNDYNVPSQSFGLAEFGGITAYLKSHKCTHICMAGYIQRPDFTQLKPDLKALKYLPGAISAGKKGDDALLRYLMAIFEKQGFEIISPQELCRHLLAGEGYLGAVQMAAEHKDDINKACAIAREMGARDIGQGAVVCGGLILAVEAQEGTDEMLKRVANLPDAKRGTQSCRKGVLAKMLKPGQDSRVDLPTIGLQTIVLADEAGLSGIAVESGQAFIIDRAAVIKRADEAGIFILGLPPSESL